MNLFNYLSLAVAAALLGGCSYKSGEFFEDLFAENRVVKSEGQFTGSIPADAKAPIVTDQKKKTQNQIDKTLHVYRGKIATVHFDKDFNLYVYTLIDHITHEPVTFYYDKNIQKNLYSGEYRVKISGNYLIGYEAVEKSITPEKKPSSAKKQTTPQSSTPHKRYKKRKRSSIKVPEEEKITPL